MSDGDRYIFKTNGSDEGGSSGTFTANKNIYELEGSTLITITPSDGDAVFVEDVDTGFVHTGSIWTPFTGASAYSWGNGLSAAEGTTINVNPGTGIQISGDTVAAKLNATSGLEVDANGLALADSIAGTGLSISNKILSATDSSVTNEINTVTDGANTTTGLALTMTGAGISTASVSGNTITITSTEVDGSTTNEINTVSADSGGATTGLAITLAGGTNASTVRSVDTVTINVDDAFIKNNVDDITSGTLTIQSTTPKDLIIDNSTVAADADSGYITLRGNDYTATTNTELDMNMFLDVTSTSDYKLSIKNDDKTAEIASLDESGNLQIDGGITLGSTALSEANLIDLTDGGETTLHTHAASAPTAHADTHEHDGADPLYWSELARADGVSTTISSEIDSDISTHAALTTTHGVSGAIVGTTDSQELTNKTITTVANGLTVGTTQLVAASGNIGIGTATPTEKLDVNGNIIANHIELRGSSPATITFGEGASAKALQFDPTTGEFEFSGGKLKQAFQNLVRNGSFESYRPGAWENHNTTWGTDMDIITDSAVAKFETRYLRILDSSNTSAKGMRYRIAMPDRLKGEDITISFWARCATGTETASIGYSYGASATDATTAKNISLTTTWQNFTWTFPDAVTDNTTLELYIYLYGAGVNNPNAEGVGTITGTATSSGYVYFDGATLVQGKLALDYGPTPILDTGNQILYGNLAIGADTDPTSGGSSFPTLYFGEPPTDFYYSGYGGWSMESGMIKYEQFSGYGSGRFMFNKPIRIYPIYTESWGAGFHLGSGAGINFADNRIDAYIEGKVEADGGFYGDGSNLTNIQGTSVQLNSNGAIVNDTGLKINLSGGSGLSITSNQLALDSTYSSGSAYDGRFVKDAGDTMTGKLIINESAVTNNAQALDINSTGIMASATNKTIASISDSAAHTTTGTITGLEVDFSGGTYTNATARGINIQMKAASDRAINTNAEIKGATLTDGTASISSGALTGLTNATVDDSGTLTFKDASGNTIMQLVESTRTAQIYNLNVNGTTTTINTTTTDADHLTLSPGAVGTTAINIVPNQGITLSGNLITAKKVSTGDNVFVIDKDGNITTVGNVDGIDVSSLATAAVANDVSTIATGDQIYDFVIGLGYITDGNTNWDNSYGYITASDTLTGLVRSTESGASYITGGKVGIGMTSPTADLTVKGNLTTALTNTATSSGALVTCTAHGLAVGDAVKMPTGAASANEIFTIIEPVAANTFTVDSTPTNDLGTATTIYKDSNLLLVQSGDGVSMLTLDKSGDLTVEGTINATVEGTSSNANLLDQKNSTQFLRSDINDSVDSNATLNIDAGSTLSIDGNWDIGGTGVTPTAAEINILDGGLSAAELDSDLLTAAEGNSSYVAVGGDTMTGGLIMSGAAVSVDAGQNLNMEGSAGDSYMQYNSTNGRLEVFVDGDIVAYFDN